MIEPTYLPFDPRDHIVYVHVCQTNLRIYRSIVFSFFNKATRRNFVRLLFRATEGFSYILTLNIRAFLRQSVRILTNKKRYNAFVLNPLFCDVNNTDETRRLHLV